MGTERYTKGPFICSIKIQAESDQDPLENLGNQYLKSTNRYCTQKHFENTSLAYTVQCMD